ncbi:hypothetical protein HOLleu_21939 [Holothuria leucospilota]|uniref:Uncharacterized protein n=1 Tax=Holothuria leucospilota TaxID=206669 RepID=A0A9Q1BY80_HOLLE|nr:hypothetical protein HOLleu_21939 [Holothuria leucospilota]
MNGMASLKLATLVRGFSTCGALQGSNRYARITSKMGTSKFHPRRGAQPVGLNHGDSKSTKK